MARSYSWTVLRQNQMEMGKVTATRKMENTLTRCQDFSLWMLIVVSSNTLRMPSHVSESS